MYRPGCATVTHGRALLQCVDETMYRQVGVRARTRCTAAAGRSFLRNVPAWRCDSHSGTLVIVVRRFGCLRFSTVTATCGASCFLWSACRRRVICARSRLVWRVVVPHDSLGRIEETRGIGGPGAYFHTIRVEKQGECCRLLRF